MMKKLLGARRSRFFCFSGRSKYSYFDRPEKQKKTRFPYTKEFLHHGSTIRRWLTLRHNFLLFWIFEKTQEFAKKRKIRSNFGNYFFWTGEKNPFQLKMEETTYLVLYFVNCENANAQPCSIEVSTYHMYFSGPKSS